MPPSPAISAYKDPLRRFQVKWILLTDAEGLCEEASWEGFMGHLPDKRMECPYTPRYLDAREGNSRHVSGRPDPAELRAVWFSRRNRGPLLGIKTASRDAMLEGRPCLLNNMRCFPNSQEGGGGAMCCTLSLRVWIVERGMTA